MPETLSRLLAVRIVRPSAAYHSKIPWLLPTLHSHSMRLATRNFSHWHSRPWQPSPGRLHFTARYYLTRPAFGFHLRVLALHSQLTSFGRWDPLSLCLCLSQSTMVSYFCLSLNQRLPPANTAEISTSSFEWKEVTPKPPNEPASIVFGRDSLVLTTEHAILAEFPYPTADPTDPLTSARYTLLPASSSLFCPSLA